MTHARSFARALAVQLARHAGHVLPEGDEDWAKAIVSEIDYLPTGRAALAWAIGGVYASYRGKFGTPSSLLRTTGASSS